MDFSWPRNTRFSNGEDHAGRLLERHDLLTNPLKHILDLVAYHLKAVALVFGDDHPAVSKLNDMLNPRVGLTAADLDEIRSRVVEDNEGKREDFAANPDKYADWEYEKDTGDLVANGHEPRPVDPEIVTEVLARFMPSKVRDLNERLFEVERENATFKALAEHAERDASELRQDLNRHVTTPLKDAVSDWYTTADFLNLAARTQHEVRRAVDSFVTTLPDDFKLADLHASHILAWRDGLRTADEKKLALAARTLIKNTMYLRSFVSAAYVRYDLRANPMDKIRPPTVKASQPLALIHLAHTRRKASPWPHSVYCSDVEAVALVAKLERDIDRTWTQPCGTEQLQAMSGPQGKESARVLSKRHWGELAGLHPASRPASPLA